MGKQHSWMARAVRGSATGLRWAAIGLIRLYQGLISPLLGPCCRFTPSCSVYAVEAVQQHGLLKGSWLSLLRVCKCHPFHPGGVDVVPSPRVQQAGKVI